MSTCMPSGRFHQVSQKRETRNHPLPTRQPTASSFLLLLLLLLFFLPKILHSRFLMKSTRIEKETGAQYV